MLICSTEIGSVCNRQKDCNSIDERHLMFSAVVGSTGITPLLLVKGLFETPFVRIDIWGCRRLRAIWSSTAVTLIPL